MTTPLHLDAAARALDALPTAEADAFDNHLEHCESCRVEFAEFVATAAMLGTAVAEDPPSRLRANVMAAAARTPQLPPLVDPTGSSDLPSPRPEFGHSTEEDATEEGATEEGATEEDATTGHAGDGASPTTPSGYPRVPSRPRWRRPVLLVAAAVAAVLIAAGVVLATRQGGTTPQQAAAQCVAAAPDAQTRNPSVGSGGSVTFSRSCNAAVVSVAAMPALPPGRAYQLWVMAGSAARSAGMVATDEDSARHIIVTGIVPTDTDIGISVEPSAGSRQPTTAPVWVVPLPS